MLNNLIEERINKTIQKKILEQKKETYKDKYLHNIDTSFLSNPLIIKDYILFYKHLPRYRKELKIIFFDLETLDFLNTPSVKEYQVFIESNLEKINLYEHSIRVAKLVIKHYVGSFKFEDLLLLALLHDFGKSQNLIEKYNINTSIKKEHEEISALYLENIFTKTNSIYNIENLIFILNYHHFKRRRFTSNKILNKDEEKIIERLEINFLFKNLVEVDTMARNIEKKLLLDNQK